MTAAEDRLPDMPELRIARAVDCGYELTEQSREAVGDYTDAVGEFARAGDAIELVRDRDGKPVHETFASYHPSVGVIETQEAMLRSGKYVLRPDPASPEAIARAKEGLDATAARDQLLEQIAERVADRIGPVIHRQALVALKEHDRKKGGKE